MSKHRFTVETLAAGQPRAYADTIHHVRVSFENVPWNSKDGELVPAFMSEEAARHLLEKMPYAGFTAKTKGPDCEWWETRLDWLKPIDGKPASEVIPHGEPPTPKHHAAHSCGRGAKGCVNPHHLRWATKAENEADKKLHGTDNLGERHPNAKVTGEVAQEIRALQGVLSQRLIAERYGISQPNVSAIINGKRWSHA